MTISASDLKSPTTVEHLYYAIAVPHEMLDRRVYPFKGWTPGSGFQPVIDRLLHFVSVNDGIAEWVPINNNDNNDGPTSINSCPGRSLAERFTNAIDAKIERTWIERTRTDAAALEPTSPTEAIEQLFGATAEDLSFKWSDTKIRKLARSTAQIRAFRAERTFDIRDFGVGILPDDMPDTILSLNRSNKQNKPYLTGKHGQGASNTFQFSHISVIATRHIDSDEVGFTVVSQFWKNADGSQRRTPTYKYLTLNGEVMRLKDPNFEPGTFVRHIGYDDSFTGRQGVDSLYGLGQRMLVNALLPVTTEVFSSEPTKASGVSRKPYYGHFHVVKGAIHQLNRNLHNTLIGKRTNFIRIREHNSFNFHLGGYSFGGLHGDVDLGKVRFTFWLLSDSTNGGTATRTCRDAVKNFTEPGHPILFTLDGQNHAEESRIFLTADKHAGLWAAGKWMVLQVDCNDLHPRAKYDLFTSTRERTKNTPIKRMIMDALIDWLSNDEGLRDWNIKLASGNTCKNTTDQQEDWAEKLSKHLKRMVDLPTIRRRQKRQKRRRVPGGSKNRTVIMPQNPPTFIRWGIQNDLTDNPQYAQVRMYPGQAYSWCFETNAPADYWHSDGPPKSSIVILANGIQLIGGEEMKGGRVKCRFKCPEDMKPGDTGLVEVRLYNRDSKSPVPISKAELLVHVVESKNTPGGQKQRRKGERGGTEDDWVETVYNILPPSPITREDNYAAWMALGWGATTSKVGFALKTVNDQYKLFYNAELPEFLDAKRRLEPHGLSDAFVEAFELNLVTHAAMALNNELPDEESFMDQEDGPTADEQRIRLHAYYAAVTQTLVIETMQEVKLNRDLNKKTS